MRASFLNFNLTVTWRCGGNSNHTDYQVFFFNLLITVPENVGRKGGLCCSPSSGCVLIEVTFLIFIAMFKVYLLAKV